MSLVKTDQPRRIDEFIDCFGERHRACPAGLWVTAAAPGHESLVRAR
jgi:hypothetical protein